MKQEIKNIILIKVILRVKFSDFRRLKLASGIKLPEANLRPILGCSKGEITTKAKPVITKEVAVTF